MGQVQVSAAELTAGSPETSCRIDVWEPKVVRELQVTAPRLISSTFTAAKQRARCQNERVEQPVVNSPNDALAAAAALVEIERLVHATQEVIQGPDRKEMSHRAYAYVSETTWWIASLDEQFREANTVDAWEAARDADDFGRLIPGLLWIRDRISHQLPFTVIKDDRSFFDPKPGGVLHISSGYEWLPIDQIRPGRERRVWEAIYRDNFAGRGIVQGPARIVKFLRTLLENDPTCRAELERINSVDSSSEPG